jgi:hypothetical protein
VNRHDSSLRGHLPTVTVVSPTLISSYFDLNPVRYSSGREVAVRYRTAAIGSGVLIALTCGMFGLEAALRTFLLPPSELGFPVSGFDRALLGVDFFCERWKWLLVPLTLLNCSGAIHRRGIH